MYQIKISTKALIIPIFVTMLCSLFTTCSHNYYNTGIKFIKLKGEFIKLIDGGMFTAYPKQFGDKVYFACKDDENPKTPVIKPYLAILDMNDFGFQALPQNNVIKTIHPAPGGELLAIISGMRRSRIELLDVKSAKITKIYESPRALYFPVQDNQPPFSPDGKKLLFLEKNSDESLSQLFCYDLDQKKIIRLAEGKNAKFSSWSPQNTLLEIRLIEDAEGGNLRYSLTERNADKYSAKTFYTFPHKYRSSFQIPQMQKIFIKDTQNAIWLIDSKTLKTERFPMLDYLPDFWSIPLPKVGAVVNLRSDKNSLSLMNLKEFSEKTVYYHPDYGNLGNLALSPDNKKFAFSALQKKAKNSLGALFVADSLSLEVKKIAELPAASSLAIIPLEGSLLAFTPDSQALLYMVSKTVGEKAVLALFKIKL